MLFESVLKRTVWHDKFELTYVTHSQLLLKSLQESDSTVLIVESQLGLEIDDVRFMGKARDIKLIYNSDLKQKIFCLKFRERQLLSRTYRRFAHFMRSNA